MVRDVGEALDHAHAQGVVHRDVKPGNVLHPARRAHQARGPRHRDGVGRARGSPAAARCSARPRTWLPSSSTAARPGRRRTSTRSPRSPSRRSAGRSRARAAARWRSRTGSRRRARPTCATPGRMPRRRRRRCCSAGWPSSRPTAPRLPESWRASSPMRWRAARRRRRRTRLLRREPKRAAAAGAAGAAAAGAAAAGAAGAAQPAAAEAAAGGGASAAARRATAASIPSPLPRGTRRTPRPAHGAASGRHGHRSGGAGRDPPRLRSRSSSSRSPARRSPARLMSGGDDDGGSSPSADRTPAELGEAQGEEAEEGEAAGGAEEPAAPARPLRGGRSRGAERLLRPRARRRAEQRRASRS